MKFSFFALSLLALLILQNSCTTVSESEQRACTAKDFNKIFPDKLDGMQNHSFEIDNNNSVETLTLNGLLNFPINIEILQIGCKNLVQELRFELMDKTDKVPTNLPATACAGIVIGLFEELGKMDPQLYTFGSFALVMKQKYQQFQYKEPLLLQDGFFMTLDKIHTAESTLISIQIKQEK